MVADQTREFAFYYPNPYFHDADWVKNLILFFDGLALLIPEYMADHSDLDDLAIIQGLKEHDLFTVIRPESTVDKDATAKLAEALTDVIASGALDDLTKDGTDFHELSMSRLGYAGDRELAQMIFEELKSRNLARDSQDGVSIPMHPVVRSLVLVLLAQILRPCGASQGIELSPATDHPRLIKALTELLSLPQAPSVGNVVSFDMGVVGTDLSSVDIAEVLAFRDENRDLHRNYVLSVRRFVRELSLMEEEERSATFQTRQQEIDDIANDIRKLSRAAWKTPASFTLGIAGAAWTLYSGDILGAVLAGGGALLGLSGSEGVDAGAYSYLFNARSMYG